MLKKLICSFVSIALIVSGAILFSFRDANSLIYAGTNQNEKINNMGELHDIMNFILTDVDSGNVDDNSEYESATVHISLSETIKVSQKANSEKASGKMTVEQDVTFYLTKRGVYIEAQTVVFLSSINKSTDVRNLAKTDLNIYLTQQESYIKVLDYTVLGDEGSVVLKPEYANKWIKAPRDVAFEFSPFEIELEFVLDTLSKIFDALFESGRIKEDDMSVVFDQEDMADVEIWNLDDIEIDIDLGFNFDKLKESLEIDFTDKTHPHISISSIAKGKNIRNVNGGVWLGSNQIMLETNIKFKGVMDVVISNVNNTVIDWNLDDSKIDKSVNNLEELEKIFVVKEYKEDK